MKGGNMNYTFNDQVKTFDENNRFTLDGKINEFIESINGEIISISYQIIKSTAVENDYCAMVAYRRKLKVRVQG